MQDGDRAVAIVGIGCRFPGGVVDAAGFWRLLEEGRDAIGEIPRDRIDLERLYDPRPGTPGRIVTRRGGYLDHVDAFDAAFFGISPREAERLDPQQRVLLETAWEALEDAGIDVDRLEGTRTGVYVGQWVSDFESRLFADTDKVDFLMSTGSGRYAASGRLSYALGLRGPSLTLDTACSSSLVAVHLATRALRAGDCEVALAGGVNMILQPFIHLAYSQSRMMAPDGRCKFGDASGDGYVRSEGAGLVVLKRLARAVADGDRIHAVIRGSAVNNDGRSSGVLGRPSRIGHEELLHAAYADAGLPPARVGYVEAHGTGTRAGDPVEIGALGAVVGAGRPAGQTCLIGSVKTNIGHTESAAGIAGLIKAALAVREGRVPASLHHVEPNPSVPWAELPFRVPGTTVPWPESALPRVAGVNSFGISGTNAHAVLEAPPAATACPADEAARQDDPPARPALLVLSARSAEALRALAARYLGRVQALAGAPRQALDDLCWAAATRRTALGHRVAFVAADARNLAAQLAAYAGGEAADLEGRPGEHPPAPAFVVPGQGGQWVGMARDLLTREPAFRQALAACDTAAAPYLPCSIIEQLALDATDPGYRLDRIEVIQPTLVALAIAYARWLQSVGIVPAALVGHSMGEVGAAHLAGVLDLDQAMRIVCRRSALMARTRGQGGMAVVGLSLGELEQRLAAAPERAARLSVAAHNGPRSCVVAGHTEALAVFMAELEAAGIFARAVQVDVASHSPQMEAPAAALGAELGSAAGGPGSLAPLAPRAAEVPLYSTVLGRLAEGGEFDAAYWGRNLRQPVRFQPCIDALLAGGTRWFVELGPHPVLCSAIQQVAEARGSDEPADGSDNEGATPTLAALACGRRDEPGTQGLMAVVGRLWAAGLRVDWAALLPRARRHVDLPLYPWQRERHWHEAADQRARAGTAGDHGRPAAHPLLEQRFDPAGAGAQGATCWQGRLEPGRLGHLADHVVRGSILFPAAAYCEVALAAAAEAQPGRAFGLRDVEFHAAWALPATAGTAAQLQVRLDWTGPDAARFEIHGRNVREGAAGSEGPEAWVRRASGRLVPRPAAGRDEPLAAEPPSSAPALAAREVYARLAECGLGYGAAYRALDDFRHSRPGTSHAEVRLGAADLDRDALRHIAYPPLIDAMLQAQALALAIEAGERPAGATPLPVRLAALDVHAPLDPRAAYTLALTAAADGLADIDLLEAGPGRRVASLRGVAFERLRAPGQAAQGLEGLLFAPSWLPLAATDGGAPGPAVGPTGAAAIGTVLVVADDADGPDARDLLAALAQAGLPASCLTPRDLAASDAADRLARALGPSAGGGRAHIVHVAALAGPPPDAGLEWIESCWQRAGDDALALARLAGALEHRPPPRVWLVTRHAQATGHEPTHQRPHPGAAALWGLGRVWAHEQPALDVTLVDVDAGGLLVLPALLAAGPADRQLALRGGRCLALQLDRHAAAAPTQAGSTVVAFEAAQATPGTPDSLHWRSAARPAPGPHEVEVTVEAAGLNFMNLMSVLGIYPGYEGGLGPLGIECSGRIARLGAGVRGLQVGQAVVAVGHRCLQRFAVVGADLVAPRPAALEPAAAAGTPIAFLTALYALRELARLGPGERVLVHSAAGGVGLAALQVARHLGAEVVATAGSDDKRALLHSLGVAHVFDSRSTRFADDVLAATGGRGVDVVLNSLAGEAIAAGLRCLAPYGRFVELGKRDIYGGTSVALAPFRANLSYFAVDLDRMMCERPAILGGLLRETMQGFADGTWQPLPMRCYGADDLVAAFRDLMPGAHVGKHVVSLAPAPARVEAAPALHLPVRADGCYVVSGGLGALGLEVAQWLARRGAGAVMLLGRSAPAAAVRARLDAIAAAGTRVLTEACDVADPAAVARALERARREGGPLAGVFHAAGVLADATLDALTPERLRAPRDAKVLGAWNLDRLTEHDALDTFVLFSSVASLFGTPGQGNYAAANAFLDTLAADRRARGKPALALNLGPVADVGLAAAEATRGEALGRLGFGGLEAAQVVQAIDALAAAGTMQAVCARVDIARWLEATARAGARGLLRAEGTPGPSAGDETAGAAEEASLAATLAAVPAGPPRRARLDSAIKAEVAAVLRMAAARVPADRALRTLGLDSLMALELRNRLEKLTGLPLSPTLAWNHPTVRALAAHLAERMQVPLDSPAAAAAGPAASAPPPAQGSAPASAAAAPHAGGGADTAADDTLDALLDDLENMSDEEARALLAQGAPR